MESDDVSKSEKGSLLYSTQPDKLKKTESGRIASGVVKKRETSGKDEPFTWHLMTLRRVRK